MEPGADQMTSQPLPNRRTLFEKWYRKCEKWIFAGKSNVVEQKNNSDVDEASGSAEIRAWSFKNVDFSLSYTGIHTALLLLSCFVIGRQNRSRASREKMDNPWGLPIIDQFNMYTEAREQCTLHSLLHHAWASTLL